MRNWISEYAEFAAECTDAPPAYHRYVAMTLIGTILGNRLHFTFGYDELMPNIWLVLVGESTFTHKSASMKIGRKILMKAAKHLIYPTSFSPEGLYKMVEKQNYGSMFIDEFGAFLGRFKRKYMEAAKEDFTELFDCYEFSRGLSGSEMVVHQPRISLVACTTPEWFVGTLKHEDVSAGFLPRFLPVLGKVEDKTCHYSLPPAYDREKENNLITGLRRFQEISGACSFSSTAQVIYDGWYDSFEELKLTGLEANLCRRYQEYVVKFAMIHQVAATGTCRTVGDDAVLEAIESIGYCFHRLKELAAQIAFSQGRQNCITVMNCLKQRDRSMSVGEMMRSSGLTKNQIRPALESLIEEKRLERSFEKPDGGGRPSEIYRLTLDE